MQWGAFFTDMAAFAGVVFAIVLVARQITDHARTHESKAENETRLWDSLSVTYELAAAALLSILYSIRGSVVDVVFAALFVGVGCFLYIKYWAAYRRMSKAKRKGLVRFLAWLTVVPVLALLLALVSFITCIPAESAQVMLAIGVSWLVFSGTAQALYWYYNSWERGHRGVRRHVRRTVGGLWLSSRHLGRGRGA